jgi:hypothetical protein
MKHSPFTVVDQIIGPAGDVLDYRQGSSTGTGNARKGGKIAQTVSHERHACIIQIRGHYFTDLMWTTGSVLFQYFYDEIFGIDVHGAFFTLMRNRS